MIIPFTKAQADDGPQLPNVSPTYLAMAAAQMHKEGRWLKPAPTEPEPKP